MKGKSVDSNKKEYFENLLLELHQKVDFESGSLFILEGQSRSLQEAASYGEGIDFISSVAFPMGTGLSAWVAQRGQPIYLADIHRGSRHGLNPIRSYISLPLEIEDQVIGVLNLSHLKPNAFGGVRLKKIKDISNKIAYDIYKQNRFILTENYE